MIYTLRMEFHKSTTINSALLLAIPEKLNKMYGNSKKWMKVTPSHLLFKNSLVTPLKQAMTDQNVKRQWFSSIICMENRIHLSLHVNCLITVTCSISFGHMSIKNMRTVEKHDVLLQWPRHIQAPLNRELHEYFGLILQLTITLSLELTLQTHLPKLLTRNHLSMSILINLFAAGGTTKGTLHYICHIE